MLLPVGWAVTLTAVLGAKYAPVSTPAGLDVAVPPARIVAFTRKARASVTVSESPANEPVTLWLRASPSDQEVNAQRTSESVARYWVSATATLCTEPLSNTPRKT